MEIPYIVKPRKDTGLFNSKIAIWLFLASEVMLFGGFFSAYVFMRIDADYPWPERTLPVLPGLINTFILIGSSVTVVFAWAALKLRKWRQFQVFMSITVLCAVVFMCLKAVEYNVKFHHQAVRLKDYSIVEGHLAYKKDKDGNTIKEDGHKIEYNRINIKAESVVFDTLRYYKPWVKEIIEQAKSHGSTLELAEDVKVGKATFEAGEKLTPELLGKIKRSHTAANAHNQKIRTEALRAAWKTAKQEYPDKRGWEISDKVKIDESAIKDELLPEQSKVTFVAKPPVKLEFKPGNIKQGEEQSRLRDDTVIQGELLKSPMKFHHVDAIDFQYLVMQAEEKGISPEVAIENSWLIQNVEFVRELWKWHSENVEELEKELAKKGREPTEKDRYRIGWKEFAAKAEEEDLTKLGDWTIMEEFKGPNYEARGTDTFPELKVPRDQIAFSSKFVPKWNTYYAIYFTITGLHGLHVIGGALVLAYYLFFGRKMYETNPEWLTNRVEVGGLFWHFVDLIWIFAFPIFYLM
ncbi:MAG: cytochrome c oxidase subunit 3 [Akkermansiaceae bacterium]|nr:cytochrome c oxidase subunit 3 [Akkermansiaceae bacterium]